MPAIVQGRVVWALLTSPDGKTTKRRPAVVLTSTEEIKDDEPFAVVVGSTRIDDPLPPNKVMLPWNREGTTKSRLRKPTVVVCDWLCSIRKQDVVEFGGVLPAKLMVEIAKRSETTEAP